MSLKNIVSTVICHVADAMYKIGMNKISMRLAIINWKLYSIKTSVKGLWLMDEKVFDESLGLMGFVGMYALTEYGLVFASKAANTNSLVFRYMLMHEYGHIALGHYKHGERRSAEIEAEADLYAIQTLCLTPEEFYDALDDEMDKYPTANVCEIVQRQMIVEKKLAA